MRPMLMVPLAAGLLLPAAFGAAQNAGGVRLEGDPTRREKLAVIQGKPAPALEVKRWVNGSPQTLAALKGKVVLLEFWGKW